MSGYRTAVDRFAASSGAQAIGSGCYPTKSGRPGDSGASCVGHTCPLKVLGASAAIYPVDPALSLIHSLESFAVVSVGSLV